MPPHGTRPSWHNEETVTVITLNDVQHEVDHRPGKIGCFFFGVGTPNDVTMEAVRGDDFFSRFHYERAIVFSNNKRPSRDKI